MRFLRVNLILTLLESVDVYRFIFLSSLRVVMHCFCLQNFLFLKSYENFLREYARMSMYGFIIASSFLQVLHDPEEIDFEQMHTEGKRLGPDFFVQVN